MVNINLKIQSICSSTNDLAFQAANDGLDQGTSYLSYKQTKGRGRNNNKWNSLEGNLFLSTIIRPIKEKKTLAAVIINSWLFNYPILNRLWY